MAVKTGCLLGGIKATAEAQGGEDEEVANLLYVCTACEFLHLNKTEAKFLNKSIRLPSLSVHLQNG